MCKSFCTSWTETSCRQQHLRQPAGVRNGRLTSRIGVPPGSAPQYIVVFHGREPQQRMRAQQFESSCTCRKLVASATSIETLNSDSASQRKQSCMQFFLFCLR